MVVDTSALLALIFEEAHAEFVERQLALHGPQLVMSTVNLAEVLILLKDRNPLRYEELEAEVLGSGVRFVAPDVEQARLAGAARTRFPLNLGECFAYALAVVEECPILTLDRDFRAVDRPVVMP